MDFAWLVQHRLVTQGDTEYIMYETGITHSNKQSSNNTGIPCES